MLLAFGCGVFAGAALGCGGGGDRGGTDAATGGQGGIGGQGGAGGGQPPEPPRTASDFAGNWEHFSSRSGAQCSAASSVDQIERGYKLTFAVSASGGLAVTDGPCVTQYHVVGSRAVIDEGQVCTVSEKVITWTSDTFTLAADGQSMVEMALNKQSQGCTYEIKEATYQRVQE